MVTFNQIEQRFNKVRDAVNEIHKVQNALNLIREVRPQGQAARNPVDPTTYTDYTVTERDEIYARAGAELQRIKASL